MKSLLLLAALALGATACTTLSNRRDLYNPSEDTSSYNSLSQKRADSPDATPALRGGPLPEPQ